MIRIDVRDLNVNKTLRVRRRRAQALAQEFRHRLDELCVQPRETLQFLVSLARQQLAKIKFEK